MDPALGHWREVRVARATPQFLGSYWCPEPLGLSLCFWTHSKDAKAMRRGSGHGPPSVPWVWALGMTVRLDRKRAPGEDRVR